VSDDAYPDDLAYSEEHEWTRDEGDVVRVGITSFAQDQLGDVVYVDLPGVGAEVRRGQPFGEVESTKSVSDLFAPVSGTIADRNEELDDRPELVNQEPYAGGWMVTITPSDRSELDGLMGAAAYRAHVDG
jgi:glycine cleavage system H protein